MIFLIMILVILFFAALWNYDVHKILFVKSRTQNAGDAAAVMAARWQGISLNLMGGLNVMHAIALSEEDEQTASAITNIQARLCFTGPMIALAASQQAAKNNGAYSNPRFAELMADHAEVVRNDYPSMTAEDGSMLFPEPYDGCWEHYADMLGYIASEGIAAGPDNAQYYVDYGEDHYLLRIGFYEAVAGRFWCWFFFNAPGLLDDYQEFFPCWWDPLPEIERRAPINSEIFGLGLVKVVTRLENFGAIGVVTNIAVQYGFDGSLNTNATRSRAAWYCYDPAKWTAWEAAATGGPDAFPLTGSVKPRYDYAGADAAVRVVESATRLTPGAGGRSITNTITWTAAAKPFGFLEEERKPTAYGLVLPAFHEARLIPVDTCSGPSAGAYNYQWRIHIEHHLPDYMDGGPSRIEPNCWFCQQLVTWENAAFRMEGSQWLDENSHLCTISSGGGTHRGGGTRRGH